MQKLVVFSLLAFIIYYPNQSKASTINQANNLKNATIGRHNKKVVSKDSLRFFTVDDFPVTNRMFRKIYNHNQSFKMKSGKIYSLDKAWFTNDTLDQTLVFELYTDFFRTDIYLFKNSDIPNGIIKQMELFITEDSCSTCFDAIGYKQKVPFFRGFIRKSEGINSKFFTSIKGFKINDLKEKALKIYGQPNHSKIENGIECCEWDFCGDYQLKYDSTNNNKINLHGKSIAKNSFGNEIYMYFRNNKLIGYVITNYTP